MFYVSMGFLGDDVEKRDDFTIFEYFFKCKSHIFVIKSTNRLVFA